MMAIVYLCVCVCVCVLCVVHTRDDVDRDEEVRGHPEAGSRSLAPDEPAYDASHGNAIDVHGNLDDGSGVDLIHA